MDPALVRRRHPGSPHRLILAATVAALLSALAPGAVLPVAARDEAASVSGPFSLDGDAAQKDSLYDWDVPDTPGFWQLEITGPPDELIGLELLSADLTVLDRTRSTGGATLFDLALEPGRYVVKVPRSARDALPFQLTAMNIDAVHDAEPNDDIATASAIEVGQAAIGRLADANGDSDHFRLNIAPGATSLLDVKLESSEDVGRIMCLLDAVGRDRVLKVGSRSARCVHRLTQPWTADDSRVISRPAVPVTICTRPKRMM